MNKKKNFDLIKTDFNYSSDHQEIVYFNVKTSEPVEKKARKNNQEELVLVVEPNSKTVEYCFQLLQNWLNKEKPRTIEFLEFPLAEPCLSRRPSLDGTINLLIATMKSPSYSRSLELISNSYSLSSYSPEIDIFLQKDENFHKLKNTLINSMGNYYLRKKVVLKEDILAFHKWAVFLVCGLNSKKVVSNEEKLLIDKQMLFSLQGTIQDVEKCMKNQLKYRVEMLEKIKMFGSKPLEFETQIKEKINDYKKMEKYQEERKKEKEHRELISKIENQLSKM